MLAYTITKPQPDILRVTKDGTAEPADFVFAGGNYVFQSNSAAITGGTPVAPAGRFAAAATVAIAKMPAPPKMVS
jgi:hypothetical protein